MLLQIYKGEMTKLYLFVFILLSSFLTFSQVTTTPIVGSLIIKGYVKKDYAALEGVNIVVLQGTKKIYDVNTAADGKFDFKFDFDKKYRIEVSKADHVTKRFEFDTYLPESEPRDFEYVFKFTIDLFPFLEGVDFSVLDKPLAIIKFDNLEGGYSYDYGYAKALNEQVVKLKEEVEAILKERNLKYNKFITEADRLLKAKSYEGSRANYVDASKVRPDVQYPKDKIAEIDVLMANSVPDNTTKYNELIAKADKDLSFKKYNEALTSYKGALGVKPEQQYPKDQINKIELLLKDLADKDANYNKAIAEADANLTANDYTKAKENYNKALGFKPEEIYPKDQIRKIDNILNSLAIKNDTYNSTIALADKAFNAKEYNNAKDLYTKASTVKTDEQYPKNQIKIIEGILNDLARKEVEYSKIIVEANNAFNNKIYDNAKVLYTNALSLKPNESYPKVQIEKIEKILSDNKSKDVTYYNAISQADQQFKEQQYQSAIQSYKEASSIKPEENYPKDQIIKVDAEIKLIAENENNYNLTIATADKAFNGKDYKNAKDIYNKALTYKPSATYPKEQIAKIDNIFNELAGKDEAYNKAIASADNLFNGKDYINSKNTYNQALTLKPNEVYPKEQITKIDNLLKEQAGKEEAYKKAIVSADNLFNGKDYNNSKNTYNQALTIKPNEIYPKEQIAKIDNLLKDLAGKDEEYKKAIASADNLFNGKDYANSKNTYNQALAIKPNESYPKDQITKIDIILKDLAGKEEAYKKAIASADNLFNSKDYANSKNTYNQALSIKPNESYPKEQISKIDNLLKDLAGKEEAYKTAIANADKAFNIKDYSNSKNSYNQALSIKPNESYPKEQIAKIDNLLKDLAGKEEAYKKAIASADNLFNSKDYANSKSTYNQALSIKPNESYPKEQISKIDNLLKEIAAKEEAYKTAIATADKAFNSKDYSNSKNAYNQALSIKPNESYPKEQLAKIDNIINEMASKENAYDSNIASAENELQNTRYNEAISYYEKASAIKPTELYPKDQIAKINNILKELAGKELAYKTAIENADKAFNNKDYNNSKNTYNQALTLKPNEVYPKEQISKIDNLLKELAGKEDAYKTAITNADNLLNGKDYANAKNKYNEAIALKPNETYPKDQISKIDNLLKQQAAKEDAYKTAIASADNLLNGKDYTNSKNAYNQALTLKPNESYPKEQIAKIDNLLKELAGKEDAYNKAIASADNLLNGKDYANAKNTYNQALAIKPNESYPKEQISKIDNLLKDLAGKDEAYKTAIANADNLFNGKDYTNAKNKYNEAIALKPNEIYPKDQLKQIDKIEKESLLKKDTYDKAIVKADEALGQMAYDKAKVLYNEALTILPEQEYPKNKIKDIDDIINKQKERRSLFENTVKTADNFYTNKKYNEALDSYKQASQIFPDEPYPMQKVKEIIELLKNNQIADDNYKNTIAKADVFFNNKDYDNAITAYKTANEIKPQEQYPQEQIGKINKISSDLAANEQAYKTAIANADLAYSNKNYNNAKTNYNEALTYKSKEIYPQEQINKINKILSDLETNNKAYDNAIASADLAFNSKDYNNAKSYYNEALRYKSNEAYPQDQINKIGKIFNDLAAANEQAYKTAIANADLAFNNKNYNNAKASYNEALTYKSKEIYPQEQINKINKILSDLEANNKAYDKAIENADLAFNSKDYDNAKSYYNEALRYKSNEAYPKEQIDKIGKIFNDLSANEQAYKMAIAKADLAFNNKSYNNAKIGYNEALTFKPKEIYPQDQIYKINKILSDIEANEQAYKKAIASADLSYNNKDYNGAIAYYNEALRYKSNETYPQEQITKINKIFADLASLEQSYKSAISKADLAFNNKDYDNAKIGYNEALTFKSKEVYPQEQITRINKIYSDIETSEQAYKTAISNADLAYNNKNYTNAESYYYDALKIKPSEVYPQGQLSKIKSILSEMENKEAAYKKAIYDADLAFNGKIYEKAKNLYNDALSYKPNEVYPQEQIKKIIKIVGDLEATEKAYNTAISKADLELSNKKYTEAKVSYNEAISIKPTEAYPKEQIIKINKIINDMAANEQAYNNAIKLADGYFNLKKYTGALTEYQNAIGYKNDEEYPKKQIQIIKKILKDQESYKNLIASADELFNNKEYPLSKKYYNDALVIFSSEVYPKEQIQKIDKILADRLAKLAELPKEESVPKAQEPVQVSKEELEKRKVALSDEERKNEFLDELTKQYPLGVTEETYQEPNRKIIRVIVNNGKRANEFKKIIYKWGGVYFFKNNVSITEDIFSLETKQ